MRILAVSFALAISMLATRAEAQLQPAPVTPMPPPMQTTPSLGLSTLPPLGDTPTVPLQASPSSQPPLTITPLPVPPPPATPEPSPATTPNVPGLNPIGGVTTQPSNPNLTVGGVPTTSP